MKISHLTRNGSFRSQMRAAIATLIEYAHPEFSERWNTIEPIKREDVAQYIVEDNLFFDLECADAQMVFAMGVIFRAHTPMLARNAESVKKLLPTLENWGNAAQFICGHNAIAHDVPVIRDLDYRDLTAEQKGANARYKDLKEQDLITLFKTV